MEVLILCLVSVEVDGFVDVKEDNEMHLIIKLAGEDNFSTWRIVVKTLLECDGMLDVVEGAVKKQAPQIDSGGNIKN